MDDGRALGGRSSVSLAYPAESRVMANPIWDAWGCASLSRQIGGMVSWQLQEAKQRFSEVVRRALTEGPQWVTRHGRRVVVVVAADEFEAAGRGVSFKEFLRTAPDLEELEIHRSPEPAPEVSL